ncbi:MAG TPA: S8 family serine peptidase, partial [Thermomicrobiales bacterium]|nr:S8 family serine peptidase [Thermomicrobiales bacterium]
MTSNDPTIRLQRWLSAAILAITLLVLILPLGAIQQSAAQTSDEPPPSGDVIVVLADHASPMAVTEASSALDNVVPDQVYTSVFNGFSATVTQAEANALADDPRVEAIYPDGVFYQAAQTVPTGVERIGNLNNPSADIDGIDDVRINADIAILDTGVSDTTSDLNLVGGVNCVDKTGETGLPYSFDGTGHGTHVAGIAAALDNDRGVVGVAPGARVYSVRVLASNGTGLESWLICGLDWVLKRSSTIDVVNMSIQGSGDDGDCDSSALHLAICQVVNDAGVPVVVAAGNSHQDAESTIPATFDQVIAVSNMADYDGLPGGLATMGPNGCPKAYGDDTLSGTSNFGPDVDIAAPGTCILSLVPGGGTTFKSGTSMASPHVAGAVALYKAVNPRATPSGVRAWLLNTAKAQSSD